MKYVRTEDVYIILISEEIKVKIKITPAGIVKKTLSPDTPLAGTLLVTEFCPHLHSGWFMRTLPPARCRTPLESESYSPDWSVFGASQGSAPKNMPNNNARASTWADHRRWVSNSCSEENRAAVQKFVVRLQADPWTFEPHLRCFTTGADKYDPGCTEQWLSSCGSLLGWQEARCKQKKEKENKKETKQIVCIDKQD